MGRVLMIGLLVSGLVAGIGSPAAAGDAQKAPQGIELVGADTPWSTFLVVGPTVRWQNGEASVWPLKGCGQLRVGRLVHDN